MNREQDSRERRKHRRHSACDDFRLVIGVHEASTINLSASGALCTVDKFLPLFMKTELTIMVPVFENGKIAQIHPLQVTAIVIRVDPEYEDPNQKEYRVAFYFSQLDEFAHKVIQTYLSTRPVFEGFVH